jgi:multidrug resistance efflux pump
MKNNLAFIVSLVLLLSCGKEEKQSDQKETIPAQGMVAETNLVVAIGKVEPEKQIINLSASAGGIVKSTFKKEGDTVSIGEPLVQLDDDAEQNKLQEIRMQIQSQRSQIEVERLQLNEAEVNLRNKNSLLAKTERLVKAGAETQQVYDDLATEVNVLELGLQRLKAEMQVANSKLNELSAQLKTAENDAQKRQFHSPFEGVLLDLQVNKGESVNQYSTYAALAPQGKLTVRAEVDELFNAKIKTGQAVEVFYTGSNNVIATGEIVRVAPYLKKKSLFSEKANDQEDRRVREISIALKADGNLIINSKVECKIKL